MSISTTQLTQVLGAYFRANNKVVKSMVYSKTQVTNYTRTIGRIKGRFPALHSITTDVIQGFTSVWSPLGITKFKVNELVNFHQKVNYAITPDDIESTWLAELDDLGKTPQERPITQYIVDKELMPKIEANRNTLHGKGQYDATKLGQFGYSMNGLLTILNNGINSTDNPMYVIPISAITDSNIVDMVEQFEAGIPQPLYDMPMPIFMSSINARRYKKDYRATYGRDIDYTKDQTMKSYLTERPIVGLTCLNGSDAMFCTVPDNFLYLTDLDTPPRVSDVQALDYQVKIFIDWWEGLGFWMNQLVMVAVPGASGSGLGNGESNTYFS